MGRVFKSALCIVIAVGLLCLSFSVFAVDDAEPTANPVIDPLAEIDETLMLYYIWLTMRVWGIDVTLAETEEYTDEIGNQILNWVLEYLDSFPSAYSIAKWIAPWQIGADYWGNYKFNSSMLEDIQDFVDWLVDELGLTDNSTTIINPINTFGGTYTLYETNRWYQADLYNGTPAYFYVGTEVTNSNNPPQYFFLNLDGNSMKFIFINDLPWSAVIKRVLSNDTVTDGQASVTSTSSYTNAYGNWYYRDLTINNYYPLYGNYFEGNATQLRAFLSEANIDQIGDLKVITGEIELPTDNPNYSPGDGLTIVGDEPSYSVIEFSGEVTNLPAIVSTGKVDDPQLGNLFSWIPTFVNMASDSMNFFKQVVYMMPDQVLVCIFAVMGAGVLFGILRLMREH